MIEIHLQQARKSLQLPPTWCILAIELAIALLIGSGIVSIGLESAAWILGGIGAGAFVVSILRMLTDQPIPLNRTARKIGQVIVGLAIGLSLQRDDFAILAAHFPIFIGLPLGLMLSSSAIAVLYARLESIDSLTALLATTPGNIGVVASIAADYARNLPLVSLVQLMRFTSVMLVMPSIASVMVTNITLRHPPHQSTVEFFWQLLAIPMPTAIAVSGLFAIALVAAYLGNRFKIPMAAFLGAIVIGLVADNASLFMPTLSLMDLKLPLAFSLVGQILLGITIGEHWGINPPLKPAIIARAAIPVSLMFLATAAFASLIHSLTAWHWLTCLLIAAPGGSPEMIWIALTLHQDTEIVTAGHIIRLLTINLALPVLIALASYCDRQVDTTQQ